MLQQRALLMIDKYFQARAWPRFASGQGQALIHPPKLHINVSCVIYIYPS